MRKLILSISFAGLILLSGCATVQPSHPSPDGTETAFNVVEQAIPYIKGASRAAVQLSLQYAEKDAEKRLELQMRIHVVALNLQALLDRGDFSPGSVRNALKVKEEYVDNILSAVGTVYTTFYDKLAQNKQTDMALRIMMSLTEGVAEGTN